MSTRLPRWTWLLVLPMLVGALVLMHRLDVHAGHPHPAEGAATAPVLADHPHDDSTPADHGNCVDCGAGHAMAACVAIITAVGGIALARLLQSRRGPGSSVAAVAARLRGRAALARPPDPAWVRLSVMRC